MGLFKKKSAAEKARKEEIKDAKKEARRDKKDARKDAREDRRENRRETRDEKKDARKEKREEIREIKDSDLKGKEKRDAKKDARKDKRDAVKVARQDKRDTKKEIRTEKKETIEDIRERKRRALKKLRVPKAMDRKWNSYLRFQEVKALEIYKPKTLAHIKTVCRIATEEGLKVRAVGSGHSFSAVGVTDDILIMTDGYDEMLPMSTSRRRKFKTGRRRTPMAEFEVGKTVIEISKALEKTNEALGNQGTYDGQTFWGAVSTSTHGSGLGRGPFPDMVLSFVLVGEGGRTYRIEPEDGITNPDGWREAGIDELIQDDDVFYSAVCSFGSMGVVYSAIIETRPFYWLNEWTFITTWQEFKENFPNVQDGIDFLRRWDDPTFLVSPNIAKSGGKKGVKFKGQNPMSMTLRVQTPDRRKIGGRFFDSVAKAFERFKFPITGNANADGSDRSIVGKLLPFDNMPEATDLPGGDAWLSKTVVRNSGQRAWMGEVLTRRSIQDMPIKRRNKCYKIFPKGGKLFGGYGSELAFPVDRTYDVMDRIIELAEENRKDKLYHTAPIAVRFVKEARALISPQNGRETVMFEVLMAKGTKDGDKALRKVEQALIDDPECRIHWGLNVDVIRGSDAERMYGTNWDRFKAVFDQFNRQNTFANEFTDRMGLSD